VVESLMMATCPGCGARVPARPFCAVCGAALAPAGHGEERRVVTTLFCDLVGFTALSERNDPEVVHIFLRRYYAAVRRVIESFGGGVEKYIGDAVVAVFGAPALHEDDPERAVRAGLRIVDEVDALAGIGGDAVEVRVGINTGEALVRLDVDPGSGEGFLTGDAVNVAARLQSAAPPMAVAVGEATYQATRKVFAFDACHPVTLKGKSKPLAAWLATAPLARTGSELRSFSTSFVGREEELAVLQGMLDTVAESGGPRCLLVSGEPGIGKSRLLAEFARRLDDEPATVDWRQGRCLPFGSGVTFWALSEIVKAQAGILESDGVARTEARLDAALPEGEARDRLRARLRPLLGLEADEATRDENFAAWREFLEGLGVEHPVVVAVEDLHWADDAMLAFMDYLGETVAGAPLLIIATARPELLERTGPGAGFVEAAVRVTVEPLSGEETAELARARLGAKSLPTDLQALILERSGGNPLFAEELVRLLEDRDLLDSRGGRVSLKPGAEVPTPDSIGALIAARLDLLAAGRKALLSDAAVVGRTFWAGAVAAVGLHDAGEVFEGLHELVAKELVRPERGTTIEGETEFAFVHALVRDVAYDQLTRADRAAKHARLARWLEGRTAGRTEDLAEVLAFHYGTALDMAASCGLDDLEDELADPTTRYLELAGGRAAPLDAAAAAAHFARAERVADEAAKPKRRWLLSRRTRRTLKRRAPLLVAALAAIVLALLAAFAIYEFRPVHADAKAPVALTPAQIAQKFAPSVVRISADVPRAVHGRLVWHRVTESGVVASAKGLIFTSSVPIRNRAIDWFASAVSVRVYQVDGTYRSVPGNVINNDDSSAEAIVKVNPSAAQLAPAPLGDSDSLKVNEPITTLARPLGGFLDRMSGKVYVLHYAWDQQTMLKHVGGMRSTARIPVAVPGGPVFDQEGKVVGVMGSMLNAKNAGERGRDVAVAIHDFVARSSLLSPESARGGDRFWLGIAGENVTPALTRQLSLPVSRGVLIQWVTTGGPAAVAGIRGGTHVRPAGKVKEISGGDIVVAIDSTAVRGFSDLLRIMRTAPIGSHVVFHVVRAGKAVTIPVTVTANPWQ
jgi:class 3 adenylate cyclase/S1-C subfamily serine protease